MVKKTKLIIIFLLLANLLATGIIGYSYFSNLNNNENNGFDRDDRSISSNNNLNYEKEVKYTLYIGTNDKNTSKAISTEKATNIVNSICDKYVKGYSSSISNGYWTNDMNKSEHETTLVYTFYDASEEQIKHISDDVLKEFNQESIIVEKENACYTYYKDD